MVSTFLLRKNKVPVTFESPKGKLQISHSGSSKIFIPIFMQQGVCLEILASFVRTCDIYIHPCCPTYYTPRKRVIRKSILRYLTLRGQRNMKIRFLLLHLLLLYLPAPLLLQHTSTTSSLPAVNNLSWGCHQHHNNSTRRIEIIRKPAMDGLTEIVFGSISQNDG